MLFSKPFAVQVVSRRRSTEPWAEYAALMDKLASLLLGRLHEMGFMVAPGQLSKSGCLCLIFNYESCVCD